MAPRLPHAGGGLPNNRKMLKPLYKVAPRQWGSTVVDPLLAGVQVGCPTPVGIYPIAGWPAETGSWLPHAGGDLPRLSWSAPSLWMITPRRWGSTFRVGCSAGRDQDCPTAVGIYPLHGHRRVQQKIRFPATAGTDPRPPGADTNPRPPRSRWGRTEDFFSKCHHLPRQHRAAGISRNRDSRSRVRQGASRSYWYGPAYDDPQKDQTKTPRRRGERPYPYWPIKMFHENRPAGAGTPTSRRRKMGWTSMPGVRIPRGPQFNEMVDEWLRMPRR